MKKIFTLLLIAFLSINIQAQCWKAIAGESDISLAIRADGTLWSWGNGYHGNGQNLNSKLTAEQVGTDNNWKSIAAGSFNILGIKNDNTLWAWGANYNGQCGNGTYNTILTTPTQIGTDNNWKTVSVGVYHCVGIKADSTLWVWGGNYSGQLGDGTNIDKNTPIQIGTSHDWKSIATGHYHTVAIKTDGTIWAWGNNTYGQIGDFSSSNNRYNPEKLGTDTDWKTCGAGLNHSMAIKNNGTLWMWGANNAGQLGNGATTATYNPTQLGTATNWQTVSGETDQSFAIKTDSTLWAWGYNAYGDLGDGTNSNKLTPTQITTNTNWKYINGGRDHTLALKTNGDLWSWGRNIFGQLGDGTTTDKITPTFVSCQTLGIKETAADKGQFSFYPNPATDVIYFANPNNQTINKVMVLDLSGRKILETNENANSVNIQHLEKGMYQLQMFSEGQQHAFKFVK
ncbi:MAG: T9SS type A sorting domain-containing protein [Bacteroidetes bacterium]|nr:T9SS type A sorting domain-containing protein [Bacteroidota bacterium]